MPTANDYKEALKKLAPRGSAWPTENSSLWVKLLDAISQEFSRISNRMKDLREEADPATTNELLQDWERIATIPDSCIGIAETIQQRRAYLKFKLTARGGQSPAYYIALALALGYTITIDEFDAFRCGRNRCGDPLNGWEWDFTWRVNRLALTPVYFRAGQSTAGEPLLTFLETDTLACIIRKRAPAHTLVIFGNL